MNVVLSGSSPWRKDISQVSTNFLPIHQTANAAGMAAILRQMLGGEILFMIQVSLIL
jgi:hypothetical protein